jgi:AraC-like DNA-binding protein
MADMGGILAILLNCSVKIELETIGRDSKNAFRLLHNPRLNHLFYWHFHPEYELVYIEGASATRHVGDHIAAYENQDLVMIGSNIPHLNFDHGVKTEYRKEVLHVKPDFKEHVMVGYPEMESVNELFERSRYGILFYGDTREEAGTRMKRLHLLEPLELYTESLLLFDFLARSSEYKLLHKAPFVNPYNKKEQKRLREIYAYIDEHYQRRIALEEVADLTHLSREAFCRYFKKATGSTFVSFLNQYRISQSKQLLLLGKNVGEACYECGFESLSYFNRAFRKVTGQNPSDFKKQLGGTS